MTKGSLTTAVELPKGFTDVLFLTNQRHMPHEVKHLLKDKKLSFVVLPINKFSGISHQLDQIGTVIIDVQSLDVSQQQNVARIIESLETRNIGVILLTGREELPVRSFSLAGPQVKSFSLASTIESVSVDELWIKIGLNLAYRKRSVGIVAKPAAPLKQLFDNYNKKLTEQLQDSGELVVNFAEQLRMAGLVQRDFLPTQVPNTDKVRWATTFLPAEWVSGDIYDIARIDEQHIGFYVADVVGHSMPAALLTIFLKQALVMRQTIGSSYKIFSPTEVMANLNMRMTTQKLSGYQFATCCYCLLNINTFQLSYARAGHPYPILIRPEDQPQQLEVQGPLLGIFEEAQFPQKTVQLQPGDKLLLYSDGAEHLIGSFNDQTEFDFSEEFCEVKNLPVVEMMDAFNTIAKQQNTTPSGIDDATILGLEIL